MSAVTFDFETFSFRKFLLELVSALSRVHPVHGFIQSSECVYTTHIRSTVHRRGRPTTDATRRGRRPRGPRTRPPPRGFQPAPSRVAVGRPRAHTHAPRARGTARARYRIALAVAPLVNPDCKSKSPMIVRGRARSLTLSHSSRHCACCATRRIPCPISSFAARQVHQSSTLESSASCENGSTRASLALGTTAFSCMTPR